MALDEIRRINEEEGIMQIGSHVVRPPKNKKVVSEEKERNKP